MRRDKRIHFTCAGLGIVSIWVIDISGLAKPVLRILKTDTLIITMVLIPNRYINLINNDLNICALRSQI